MKKTIKKIPVRCPICFGHGIVPHGYYVVSEGQSSLSSSCSPEKCQSCNGTGLVLSEEIIEED